MTDQKRWYAGVDWASESHHVWLDDGEGRRIGERIFKHGGEGLAEMSAWLVASSGAEPGRIDIAIEVPHGPVVETLMARAFNVHALNPKQMDRFRDRFSMAGAKDDSRDAKVMASALRTDPHCFRRLTTTDPVIVELREWSRIAEDLAEERTRLTNRMREQLWRYFPAFLELDTDLDTAWLLELWQAAPSPQKARRLRKTSIARILKDHRIRRFDADHVIDILRKTPLTVAPGTATAAQAHIASLAPRIRLINAQIAKAHRQLDELTAKIDASGDTEPGQTKQRDVEILSSLPGIGRINLATLFAEGCDALKRRDYAALRSLAGVAPVTKRSGKSCVVVRRHACHPRLANAVYHWARTATQHDHISRDKYAALRARGHTHGRALRSVADRLLNVACSMLRNGTTFKKSTETPIAA